MKLSTVQFITALFICGCSAAMAQNVPGFRQYRFNALVLNPAQAGANDFSDVSVFSDFHYFLDSSIYLLKENIFYLEAL